MSIGQRWQGFDPQLTSLVDLGTGTWICDGVAWHVDYGRLEYT